MSNPQPNPWIHTVCGTALEYRGDPNGPPDPDAWGNRRYTWRCPECRTWVTITVGPDGETLAPRNVARDPWLFAIE